MNENQLDMVLYHNLNDGRDFYMGSFASDELGDTRLQVQNYNNLDGPACFSFISNTLERNGSAGMGHWLGFFVQMTRKKIRLKFVDSFKMPYAFYGENIKDYIDRYRRLATENDIQFIFEETPFRLQASDSKACGAYAVYAILEFKNCDSNSLRNFFSSFDTKNRRANDKFVQDFVVKKWPKSFCSDIFTKDSRVPFCPEKVFGAAGCLKICRCRKGCCSKVRSLEYIRPNIKFILSTL